MVLPLVIGAAAVGVGLQAVGAYNSYEAAKDQAEASKQAAAASMRIAGFERDIEAKKFRAMELDASRRSLEQVRQAQRARALALSIGTAQGAGKGSGLEGAFGQISGQSGVNQLGIFQNLELGRNIFDLNAQISQQKMFIADAQGRAADAGTQAALGAGLSSVGSSLINVAGMFK
jgi:hypothetical protein